MSLNFFCPKNKNRNNLPPLSNLAPFRDMLLWEGACILWACSMVIPPADSAGWRQTMPHITCCYEALTRQRYSVFGMLFPEPNDTCTASVKDLCLFKRNTALLDLCCMQCLGLHNNAKAERYIQAISWRVLKRENNLAPSSINVPNTPHSNDIGQVTPALLLQSSSTALIRQQHANNAIQFTYHYRHSALLCTAGGKRLQIGTETLHQSQ
jgi:hypothetical protein